MPEDKTPTENKETNAGEKKAEVKKRSRMPEEIGVLIGFGVIYIIFAVICYYNGKPQFYGLENTINILRQISMITIVAVGMTFVIISAGIDLSVGSIIALSGVVMALVISKTQNTFLGVMAGLLAGGAVGLFNGGVVANFKVPPFIVTLSTMIAVRGLSFIICPQGRAISLPHQGFLREVIGSGMIFGKIPWMVVIMLAIVGIAYYFANHVKYGRYIYAIGGNEEAARLSGINIKKMKMLIFSISGFLTAVAGIILASRLISGDPKSGQLFELDAIAASVVGGTSLSGGRGTIIGTVFGALIIGVIANGLNILGVESYTQNVIKGGFILMAVLLDQLRKK